MKEQYVGDVNDYLKYALLRHLTGNSGLKLGVCWMLTPPDARTDGNRTGYLGNPGRWRSLDPELFELLKTVVDEPDARRLELIESSGVIPGATYFNELLPDPIEQRTAYFRRALSLLAGSDLVFFDPDNGLEIPSLVKGRKNSSKFLYLDEVTLAYIHGCSLLVYQHFPREKRNAFIERKVESLKRACPLASIWAISTAHVVFLLIAHPQHADRLQESLNRTVPNSSTPTHALDPQVGRRMVGFIKDVRLVVV